MLNFYKMSILIRRRLQVGNTPSTSPGGTLPDPVMAVYEQGYAFWQGITTGGLGGTVTHVYNYAELKTALQSVGAQIIIVHGQINGTSATVNFGYTCQSDKTLIGAPGAIINGFYIGWTGKTNVIVRNLRFQNLPDFAAAGVSKRDYLNFNNTTRVVVNHCYFRDSVGSDGMVDMSYGCDYITVSDNVFDAGSYGDKGSMIGSGDDQVAEAGKLHASFFRNRWINIWERAPGYLKGSTCHVMNDLHQSPNLNIGFTAYAVSSRNGATVRVENCDFSEFEGMAVQAIQANPGNDGQNQPYGYFDLEGNIYGPDATIALKGLPEVVWTPQYEFNSFKMTAAQVKAYVLANSGDTLTLAQMGY